MVDDKQEQSLAEDAVDALEAVGKVAVKGAGKALKLGIKGVGALSSGAIKGANKINQKIKEKKEHKKSEELE